MPVIVMAIHARDCNWKEMIHQQPSRSTLDSNLTDVRTVAKMTAGRRKWYVGYMVGYAPWVRLNQPTVKRRDARVEDKFEPKKNWVRYQCRLLGWTSIHWLEGTQSIRQPDRIFAVVDFNAIQHTDILRLEGSQRMRQAGRGILLMVIRL